MAEKTLISIIVPTKNEEQNIGRLVSMLYSLEEIGYKVEVLVVDDSDNYETLDIALRMGAVAIGGRNKGLGQAIIDGIKHSQGEIIVVMDADHSHSPLSVPNLLKPILEDGYDMTIGSRYVEDGGIAGWSLWRKMVSKVASTMAYPITGVKDSTSGFFAVRREVLQGVEILPSSWKVMLEILIKADPMAVKEVPIVFGDRTGGKSKFNKKEMKNYLTHLAKLAFHKYKPLIKFALIGASGALLHFALLYAMTDLFGFHYILSAVVAVLTASSSNYALNHNWTFKDRSISSHLIGWLKYQVMSWTTDAIYLGMLVVFTEILGFWYILSAVISVGLVFPVKFVVATWLIWSKKLEITSPDYEWNAFFKGSPIQKWWKRKIANTVWGWIPYSHSLMDYGCGSSPIITKYGDKAVGFDTNKEKIEFMLNKCKAPIFANGTLEALYRKYDHVICIEVIEHLENPDEMMKFISNSTNRFGGLVIATPDYSRPLWSIAEFFTPYKDDHCTKYTRKSLEALCKRYNFHPIKYKYVAGCDLVEMFVKYE